jgi:hypothetical protein
VLFAEASADRGHEAAKKALHGWRFNINDANCSGRENGGADFRFWNGGDDLLIRSVPLRRLGR